MVCLRMIHPPTIHLVEWHLYLDLNLGIDRDLARQTHVGDESYCCNPSW